MDRLRSSSRACVFLLATIVATAATVVVEPTAVRAAAAPPVGYAYDPLGRLRSVVTSADSAVYSYDAAGNITGISRVASTVVSIHEFAPRRATVGSTANVYGTGFSATPASNTVRFNGTTASVSQATATKLTVTVPAGATNGTISVTSPNGTATSAVSFAVGGAAPTISSFNPNVVAAGSTVTISGTNFDSSAGRNSVALGRSRAQITAASSTSLTTVAPVTSTGKVTVLTPDGAVTSSGYLWVPPWDLPASQVRSTSVANVGGQSTVNLTVADSVGLVAFETTPGTRVSVEGTNTNIGQSRIDVRRPDGTLVWGLPPEAPAAFFTDPFPVDGGTYQVTLDPYGTATGSITVKVYNVPPDPVVTLAPGTMVSAETTAPGQNILASFSGTANQRVSIEGLTSTIGNRTVKVYRPDGGEIWSEFLRELRLLH